MVYYLNSFNKMDDDHQDMSLYMYSALISFVLTMVVFGIMFDKIDQLKGLHKQNKDKTKMVPNTTFYVLALLMFALVFAGSCYVLPMSGLLKK
jgi:hypothetical protein